MAKDYVKKGRPASRNTRKKNTPKAPEKKQPVLLYVVAISLVAAFSYGLYAIKDSAQEPIVEDRKKVKEKPLPVMPEEKWEYVKELKNKTIEVEVPDRSNEPEREYQMQCGSFRTLAQADTLKARIAFVGLESIVKRTEGKNGVWYRVVLGPYQSKRKAERERHQLQRAKINGCQIWLWT